MADEKTETEETVVTEAKAEVGPTPKTNGATPPPPEPENSPRLRRFERYFGRPVVLQMKYGVLDLRFEGYMEILQKSGDVDRFSALEATEERGPHGEKGLTVKPYLAGIVNASTDGEYLLLWVTRQDGSVVEYNIDPELVCNIGFCARPPAPEPRIIQPAGGPLS